ncbi:MAG TPA: GtrA family protein [Mobilitalea sp.]|nr:GtrA family protein [Mobilitalea sp.]
MKEYIQKLKNSELFNKLFNRETITYGIAGVLTTLINFISYEGLYRLGFSNLKANLLAWVIAVTFAYIVNKLNVFHSKSETVKDEALKVTKFYGARLVSLGVEQLGIYIFVEVLGVYRWIIKGALSVIVIILNYVFSKLYIFNKKKEF